MRTPAAVLLLTATVWGGPEMLESLDPQFDAIFPPGTPVETLATGFSWVEGPVWDAKERQLLFSDIPGNAIHAWRERDGECRLYMKPSGYTGVEPWGREPGSNGLAFDLEGNLICCEHGDRRVSILKPGGGKLTLADRYQGKRLNSPNDLDIHSSGAIFFTDPPYGLAKGQDDPAREQPFCGVFQITTEGELALVTDKIERPNGIALSPDEKTLYVAQSSGREPVIFALDLKDGKPTEGRRIFFDAGSLKGPGAPDGLKVAEDGTLFATGPGGLMVIDSTGKLLGRVLCTRPTANVALTPTHVYLTSSDRLLRIARLKTP